MKQQNLISVGAIHIIVVLFFLFVYLTPTHFTFLIWNVFLALLPLDFALVVAYTKRVTLGTVFSILWLLFYPNTMYMITDYIHLQYIGIGLTVRMQCLSSWDVFTRLQHVLSLIAESFSMHMIVFVTLFAGVQFAILVISHYGVRLIQNTVDK